MPEAAEPPATPAKSPSLPGLVLRGYVSLVVALVLGTVLSLPVLLSQLRMFGEVTYQLRQLPPDDDALAEWGGSQPGVTDFRVRREQNDLWVRAEYRGLTPVPASADIAAKLRQLGYDIGGMRGGATGVVGSLPNLMTDPLVLAAMLCGTQVALGGIALFNLHRARRKGRPLPALFSDSRHGRAVVMGIATGLGLLVVGHLYSEVLTWVLGRPPPTPWDAAGSMQTSTRIVFVVFGVLGAPVTEELFFRGYLSGMFWQAGWRRVGIVFSAALFAAVHFSDPYHVPCIWLIGVVLAWLYHRNGSLLAPITAHAVNNGTAIALMFLG